MTISAKQVKELRDRTGAGVMDCKDALVKSSGDMEKAVEVLRQRGLEIAAKKASREAAEGRIDTYVHFTGRVAAMVELNCETDFASRDAEFQNLLQDLCKQVAAAKPAAVDRDGIAQDVIEKQMAAYRAEVKDKPPAIQEKIVADKMEKFYSEACLLDQPFIRDESITVRERIAQTVARMKENILVQRFCRFELGG